MRRFVLMFLGLLACPLPAAAVLMQAAPTPPTAAAPESTIDKSVRQDVVAKLSDALRDNYVFPDVGQKAAEKITTSLAAGEYDKLSDPSAFAARLSADIAAIAHDKHLRINATLAAAFSTRAGRCYAAVGGGRRAR